MDHPVSSLNKVVDAKRGQTCCGSEIKNGPVRELPDPGHRVAHTSSLFRIDPKSGINEKHACHSENDAARDETIDADGSKKTLAGGWKAQIPLEFPRNAL
jgi:hypothetical protein